MRPTSSRPCGDSLLFAACVAGAVAMHPLARAAESSGEPKAPSFAFDIAPQPLEAALATFSSISNVQVLYETSLTSGRHSAKVRGILTAPAALDAMLAGTGLIAWRPTEESFSLAARNDAGLPAGADSGGLPAEAAKFTRFLGILQASLLERLCRRAATRPGEYQIALRFSVGPAGSIERTSLIDSTGNLERDAEIVAAVQHLNVGETPPPQLPQPITMVISPRSPDVTGDCISADRMQAGR